MLDCDCELDVLLLAVLLGVVVMVVAGIIGVMVGTIMLLVAVCWTVGGGVIRRYMLFRLSGL